MRTDQYVLHTQSSMHNCHKEIQLQLTNVVSLKAKPRALQKKFERLLLECGVGHSLSVKQKPTRANLVTLPFRVRTHQQLRHAQWHTLAEAYIAMNLGAHENSKLSTVNNRTLF